MDVEEIRKLDKNKLKLKLWQKQCERETTIWEKQNMREGFKETFKLLLNLKIALKMVLIKSKMQWLNNFKKINWQLQIISEETVLQLLKDLIKWMRWKDLEAIIKTIYTIKYTYNKGVSWQTITFTDEMYSYSDTNDYIHQYMAQKNHFNRLKWKQTFSHQSHFYTINLQSVTSLWRQS